VGLTVTLVEMLKMHEFLIKCVSYMANKEAKACSDPNTLFRETTPLVLICRALCTSLNALNFLKPLVHKAYEIVLRLADEDKDVTGEVLDELLEFLASSLSDCPILLRLFFQRVYSIVNVRLEGYGSMALANFFFLRFLLPAMVTPGELIPPETRVRVEKAGKAGRSRILEAVRAMQWLANGTTGQEGPLGAYVDQKQEEGWTDRFFINLITARPDDAVSEVGCTMEFTAADFAPLRSSLFSWIWRHLDPIRARLGPQIQLHSWLADNETVKKGMAAQVPMGRMQSGMLSPPRRTSGSNLNPNLNRTGSSGNVKRTASSGQLSALPTK